MSSGLINGAPIFTEVENGEEKRDLFRAVFRDFGLCNL
jgi:hypothetical protein